MARKLHLKNGAVVRWRKDLKSGARRIGTRPALTVCQNMIFFLLRLKLVLDIFISQVTV